MVYRLAFPQNITFADVDATDIRDIFEFASRIGNVCSDTGRIIANPSLVVIIIRFLDLYGEMVAVLVDASGIESYRAAKVVLIG